jgi:hypothetical protein
MRKEEKISVHAKITLNLIENITKTKALPLEPTP